MHFNFKPPRILKPWRFFGKRSDLTGFGNLSGLFIWGCSGTLKWPRTHGDRPSAERKKAVKKIGVLKRFRPIPNHKWYRPKSQFLSFYTLQRHGDLRMPD